MKKFILVPFVVSVFLFLIFGLFNFTHAQNPKGGEGGYFPGGILINPPDELAEAIVVKKSDGHTVFQVSSGGDQGAILNGFFDLAGDLTLTPLNRKLVFYSAGNFLKADAEESVSLGYGNSFSAGWTDPAFTVRQARIFGTDQVGSPNTFLIGGGVTSNYKEAFIGQAATGTITFADAANPPHFSFDKSIEVGGQIKNSNLAGAGNAYVCANASGVLYRSLSPCI